MPIKTSNSRNGTNIHIRPFRNLNCTPLIVACEVLMTDAVTDVNDVGGDVDDDEGRELVATALASSFVTEDVTDLGEEEDDVVDVLEKKCGRGILFTRVGSF